MALITVNTSKPDWVAMIVSPQSQHVLTCEAKYIMNCWSMYRKCPKQRMAHKLMPSLYLTQLDLHHLYINCLRTSWRITQAWVRIVNHPLENIHQELLSSKGVDETGGWHWVCSHLYSPRRRRITKPAVNSNHRDRTTSAARFCAFAHQVSANTWRSNANIPISAHIFNKPNENTTSPTI